MNIVKALKECMNIVKSIARDYTDMTTVEELRTDHPELDFMDDEEIEEALRQAKLLRK